jgi:hypothetical protein
MRKATPALRAAISAEPHLLRAHGHGSATSSHEYAIDPARGGCHPRAVVTRRESFFRRGASPGDLIRRPPVRQLGKGKKSCGFQRVEGFACWSVRSRRR